MTAVVASILELCSIYNLHWDRPKWHRQCGRR